MLEQGLKGYLPQTVDGLMWRGGRAAQVRCQLAAGVEGGGGLGPGGQRGARHQDHPSKQQTCQHQAFQKWVKCSVTTTSLEKSLKVSGKEVKCEKSMLILLTGPRCAKKVFSLCIFGLFYFEMNVPEMIQIEKILTCTRQLLARYCIG